MQGHEDSATGRFVSIADAAELLGLSVAETLGIVRDGELPAIRTGRGAQWRVAVEEIDAYVSGKLEESRRMGLFEQSDFASIADLGDHQRTRRS